MLFAKRRLQRRERQRAIAVALDPAVRNLERKLLQELQPEGLWELEQETCEGSGRGFSESVDRSVRTDRFIGFVSAYYDNRTNFVRGEAGDTLPTQESLTVQGQLDGADMEYLSDEPWVPTGQTVPEYVSVVSTAMQEAINFVRTERLAAQEAGAIKPEGE